MQLDQVSNSETPATSLNVASALVIFIACILLAYFEILARVVPAWLNMRGFYSHSILLILLVLSLLWRDRHAYILSNPVFSPLLNTGLVLSSLIWFLSWAANIFILQVFAFYLVFCLGICAIAGKGSYKKLFPILSLLLFVLPLWRPVQPILQNTATTIVQFGLNTISVPVFVDGNFITIPTGVFEIRGGCSGIGFLLVSLSLTGFLMLYDRAPISRVFTALIQSGVIALFANWIRIFLIVLVGYFEGMNHPLISDHVGFGWIVYSVMFFPFLYFLTNTLSPYSKPEISHASPTFAIKGKHLILIMFLSTFAPITAFTLDHSNRSTLSAPYLLPPTIGPYQRIEVEGDYWQPTFKSADHSERSAYVTKSKSVVQTFTATYFEQTQDSEVINMYNSFVGKQMRSTKKPSQTMIPGKTDKVTVLTLLSPVGETSLVWYWYGIGHSRAHSAFTAQLAQMQQKMLGNRSAFAAAIATDCINPNCQGANKILAGFINQENFPTHILQTEMQTN